MAKISILEEKYPRLFGLIREGKLPLIYLPHLRRFGICLNDSQAYQELKYCPWSGKRLPESLGDIYYSLLEDRGIEPFEHDKIPPEMKREDWWIDRKL